MQIVEQKPFFLPDIAASENGSQKIPSQPFRILSIDGGGIRGLFAARFLAELEQEIGKKYGTSLHKHFDLIVGCSTGGIIALAIALGMPAKEVVTLYRNNAQAIFKKKKGWFLSSIWRPAYNNAVLERILREQFAQYSLGGDTRLGHAKTRVCIPAFNLHAGGVSVYKTCHHPNLQQDYHIPAYQVAMATAAAPSYFAPYSMQYCKMGSNQIHRISNNVDGGVFANDPSLIGLVEAFSLGYSLSDIQLLSIGTGTYPCLDSTASHKKGLLYWLRRKKILDVILQAQSLHTENILKVLNGGIGGSKSNSFHYERIQFQMSAGESIDLDETCPGKLASLEEKACYQAKLKNSQLLHDFCSTSVTSFKPCYSI